MMQYMKGCAVLGADVTIPKAGVSYNDDHATVSAVQTALKAKGFDPGTIDGIYGPKTQKAIKAMQAAAGMTQTGVVDYGVLMALGVDAPLEGSSSKLDAPSSGAYAQIIRTQAPTAAMVPAAASPTGWLMQPLWDGAPVKRWQGIFGAVAGALAAIGIAAAVRR